MQRHNANPLYNISNSNSNSNDLQLMAIAKKLSSGYWVDPSEGVFQFQFITDENFPLNLGYPYAFQIIRYTPDYNYEAFQLVLQGRLNNDGTFEYGGGRLGIILVNNNGVPFIKWNDNGIWTYTQNPPQVRNSVLNLNDITEQAYLDSNVLMDQIYKRNYLY